MTQVVVFSKRAREDLDEIWFYLAKEANLKLADKIIDRIFARAQILAHYPFSGRARPNIHQSARGLIVLRWLIL